MKLFFKLLFGYFIIVSSVSAQPRNYKCDLLDSVIVALEYRKKLDDHLLKYYPEKIKIINNTINADLIEDSQIVKEINDLKIITNIEKVTQRWFIIDDVILSLDSFNILVDTFGFFDKTCTLNGRFKIVNSYDELSHLSDSVNVILLEQFAYNKQGALNIVIRNKKSDAVILLGLMTGEFHLNAVPSFYIMLKGYINPETGHLYW